MGIFKGDTIYNAGGGSEGMKYGGALADADFIKIENGMVYDYHNIDRADVNFYMELKENEIPDIVINVENDTAATIHVYTVNDGLFYPVGNVGGNTVSAGEQYAVTIYGSSYTVEQVQNASTYPEYMAVKVSPQITPLHDITDYGGKHWLSTGDLSGSEYWNFSRQNSIVRGNSNLDFLPQDLQNYINNNIPNPKSKIGVGAYKGYKYYNDGPYDKGNACYGFISWHYGWKCTATGSNLIQDASGAANDGSRYSCILFAFLD